MVRKCSKPTLFAACSADNDDGNDNDYNGESGGGVVVSKKW